MKLTGWKAQFEPKILRRGEDYFYNGAVRSLDWDGETITAVVSGTDDYDVEITVSGGEVEDMDCSCPYAASDHCKHMAAVLFAAAEDGFPGGTKKSGGRAARGKPEEPPIDKAVQSLTASDARALLLRFARKYSDIAEQIMLKTSGSVTRKQIQDWGKQIVSLTVKYCDRYGYIDYRHAGDYTLELETLLDEKIPLLLESALPLDAFALTCKALQEASETEMDDSDGDLGGLYWDCKEHWQKILPCMNREERHKMFDWFQENYSRWAVADDVFEDFLFGTSTEEGAFQEAEFLRRKLDLLDEQIAKAIETGGVYLLNRFAVRRVETMEKLSMDRAEIDAYLQKHKQIPAVRKHMIDTAVREARYDDAIALLRESKEINANYPGNVSDDSNRLVELYRTLDRVEDLRGELMFQMEHVRQSDLGNINLLKEITPNEQWPDLREYLLSLQNIGSVYASLLEQEGLYDRLLDYVLKSKSVYTMDRFAGALKDKYPEEVLDFYVACLRRDMAGASSRSQYTEQVKRLKAVRRLRGGKEAVEDLVDEWRTAYPRRRAMMEELQKAGF